MGYANPFNKEENALAYLDNDDPAGNPGMVFYTTYDTSGAIIGDGVGTRADRYKIRGFGKIELLSLELTPGQSIWPCNMQGHMVQYKQMQGLNINQYDLKLITAW